MGLCWDADLVRDRGRLAAPATFRGTCLDGARARTDTLSNRLNAYRVLMTRARHGTVIWVPPGDPDGPDPAASRSTTASPPSCAHAGSVTWCCPNPHRWLRPRSCWCRGPP